MESARTGGSRADGGTWDDEQQARIAGRVARGDAAAEEELLGYYERRIYLMMVARTRNPEDARDLCQETLVAVLSALRAGQVRDAHRVSAFVHGTARNVVNSYFRTRSRGPELQPLPEDLPAADARHDLESSRRLAAVRQALRIFDAVDRTILMKTLVEGLKPGEIAQELGMTSERVRTRKTRAVRKLQERVRRGLLT